MHKWLTICAIFLMIGCTNSENEEQSIGSENSTDKNNSVQTLAENLQEPWEIVEWDERIYISERNGAIVEVNDGEKKRKPVSLEKSLADRPEAGLLGLAFPETFEDDQQVFAYYSYVEGQEVFQRIVILEEQENEWVENKVVLDQIPGGQYHQGGRIEIGPDDKLFATTGDATIPELAQNKDSLAGKILRINFDGSVPEDNPFTDSYVYSYGHRNPQGLAWNEQGELYATEHGNQAHDEVNKIESGQNYGWPEIEGDEQQEGMETPLIHSGDNTWAPSGMTYYNGSFYFASLRGQALRKFDQTSITQEIVLDGYGRIRDALATDGGVYVITNNTDGRGNPSSQDDQLIFLKLDD
ncbi:PQQ-dependent sugar dehydrogenase [Aquibacillus koreensis]|uniref:PQQ-dependent sugar dehydrogenase n=1 Tax=Aquibacillus koreensis TaxID=279446 RepID=A0A9X3WLX7_9BACI|nr:PQQ-dependent sugar dehydrogenase [Aquibacillus koreensis]MCT2534929.1 PQQ-dependent sugar dehydrogenase [Aquibacillus koreensis]MDC3422177.1 PQQ-dependent sugar dehydrogenase [Aquibacillus koreensis]